MSIKNFLRNIFESIWCTWKEADFIEVIFIVLIAGVVFASIVPRFIDGCEYINCSISKGEWHEGYLPGQGFCVQKQRHPQMIKKQIVYKKSTPLGENKPH